MSLQNEIKTSIKYTDEALRQRSLVESEIRKSIEEYIRNKKYVIGDEVIEVTASDLRNALQKISFRDSEKLYEKKQLRQILSSLYIILGLFTVLIGIYIKEIRNIINYQPEQAALVLGGLAMALMGMFSGYFFRRKSYELERVMLSRNIEDHSVENLEKSVDELLVQVAVLQEKFNREEK